MTEMAAMYRKGNSGTHRHSKHNTTTVDKSKIHAMCS